MQNFKKQNTENSETKFENHISVELDVLYQFFPYPANSVKINAYSKRLTDLGISSQAIKSFVGYQIDNVGVFPSYYEILTYLNKNNLITGQNKRPNYPRCRLCGDSNGTGLWDAMRNDGLRVTLLCLCNKENYRESLFLYDPNNHTAKNGIYSYSDAKSFIRSNEN